MLGINIICFVNTCWSSNFNMLGHIFNFVAMTIIEAIRATGNSKVPLYILVTIEITNIILDPILINIGL